MKRKRKGPAPMKFRRAATLVTTFDGGRIAVHNFLTKDDFTCSAECLDFLSHIDEWHDSEELFEYFPDTDLDNLVAQIQELVGYNALIVKGTRQAELDEKYRHEWLWGATAGFFHFSIRNTRFITGKPARALMRKRKAWRPSPRLHQPNTGGQVMQLPRTDIDREPFALMRKRRSQRRFDGKPIPLEALADCLFAGNGIVGYGGDKDYGHLPLTMTPSGGARNPFELYVYAKDVTGLKPGFYHYGALKHDLGLIRTGKVDVKAMLGTQKWPAGSAAIVLLVANFPRTMWKYHMPMAYRVVAMEAGFIGQNITLTATHHGLTAVPSGALNDSVIEEYLEIPAIESAVLLTLSIGRPKA